MVAPRKGHVVSVHWGVRKENANVERCWTFGRRGSGRINNSNHRKQSDLLQLHNSWTGEMGIMKRTRHNLLGNKDDFKRSDKLNWRLNLKVLAKS